MKAEQKKAGVDIIGRVSRPSSGDEVLPGASTTDCGNGVNLLRPHRPVVEDEGGNSRLTHRKDAGDIQCASRNHHRSRRPSFVLPCRFCNRPVKLNGKRFIELFDAESLPVCGECNRYRSYLKEIGL